MKTEINGFKIVRRFRIKGKSWTYCVAVCKVCGREWEVLVSALKRNKSCGCIAPLKPLPDRINGFRVIKDLGRIPGEYHRQALVECKVCSREYTVKVYSLKGRQSCGCVIQGVVVCRYVKSHPQLAQAIKHMMARCYNSSNQDYSYYGARGITVCDEWLADRNVFCEWSLDNGFENNKRLSIDRIDNNKGYSPDNCRWITADIQSRNTRSNVMTLELAAKMREDRPHTTIRGIAKKYGVSRSTVSNVVNYHSWKE